MVDHEHHVVFMGVILSPSAVKQVSWDPFDDFRPLFRATTILRQPVRERFEFNHMLESSWMARHTTRPSPEEVSDRMSPIGRDVSGPLFHNT